MTVALRETLSARGVGVRLGWTPRARRASTSRSSRARSSPSSAPTAPASRRCLRAMAGLIAPARGRGDARRPSRSPISTRARSGAKSRTCRRSAPCTGRSPCAASLRWAGCHFARAWPAPSTEDRDAVEEAMAAMDVTAFADRSVTELSGGERARVLLARALAQRPRFLVADEPTTGPRSRARSHALCSIRAHGVHKDAPSSSRCTTCRSPPATATERCF